MAEATPLELVVYETADGRSPFADWLWRLKDRTAGARIRLETLVTPTPSGVAFTN